MYKLLYFQLEEADAYEERRVIRSQIRVVKKLGGATQTTSASRSTGTSVNLRDMGKRTAAPTVPSTVSKPSARQPLPNKTSPTKGRTDNNVEYIP